MKPGGSPGAAKLASAEETKAANSRPSKKLTLSLEAVNLGNAVVLHCDATVISGIEALSIGSMISEVLPSAGRMVVDLAGVSMFDSQALGELVMTQMWAEASGYILTFARPSAAVASLLQTTNLLSIFDLHARLEDAIAALQQGEAQSA
jgi:anti-anti-sigma factor